MQTFAPTTQTGGVASGFVQFSAGSHALLNNYVQSTSALTPKLSLSVSGSQQQLEYFTLPPAYQTPIDRVATSQATMTSLRLRYAPTSSTSIEYGYRGAWDYQQEGRPNYDFWRNFRQNALGFAHAWKNATLTASLYTRNTFVTNRADKSSAPGTLLYTQYVPTNENGIVADWIVDSGQSTFEVRGDERYVNGMSNQYNAANVLTTTGSGTQQLADLAVQNTWRFRRGQAVAGLAESAIYLPEGSLTSNGTTTALTPRTYRALSPRLAFRYDLTHTLAFRVSGGTGLRAPYLNELVRGYVIGPVFYLPNPNLAPERSSSVSAGFDDATAGGELSVDFIETFVTDAISFRTIDPTHQIRSNFAHTETDGTTVSYTRRLGICSTVSTWANAQNARVTSGTPATIGKQLPYVPQTSAYAQFDRLLGETHAGLNVSYMGPTYADDLNLQPLGTAVTAGAYVSVPLHDGVRAILRGENITNARYLSSIDRYGPPAVVSLAIAFPVNKQASDSCATTTNG
jgi:outer membrane receptor protein involved in Fe transport